MSRKRKPTEEIVQEVVPIKAASIFQGVVSATAKPKNSMRPYDHMCAICHTYTGLDHALCYSCHGELQDTGSDMAQWMGYNYFQVARKRVEIAADLVVMPWQVSNTAFIIRVGVYNHLKRLLKLSRAEQLEWLVKIKCDERPDQKARLAELLISHGLPEEFAKARWVDLDYEMANTSQPQWLEIYCMQE